MIQHKVLLDFNLNFCKGVFAMQELTYKNENGEVFCSGGIFNIVNIIKNIYNILGKYNTEIFICLDTEPTVRKKIFPEYKQGRESSDIIRQARKLNNDLFKILAKFENIKFVKAEGYEADDCIASLAMNLAKDENNKIIILSSDKDMYQLSIFNNIVISKNFENNQFVFMTQEQITEKFGVKPHLLPIFRSIKGDSADGINAAALNIKTTDLANFCNAIYCKLNEGKTLDNAYDDAIDMVKLSNKSKQKLIDGKNKFLVNYQVTALTQYYYNPLNIEYVNIETPLDEEFINLLNKFDLKQFSEFYFSVYKVM